ncbi:MAG: hypothetical protein WCK77_12895 [Verrucomicrobiota bacterium]
MKPRITRIEEDYTEKMTLITGQNPVIIEELRVARQEDLAGEFKPFKPRHPLRPSKSK